MCLKTGVDLAGFFSCKCVAHRSVRHYKIYAAVFVCLTVHAVHIEIVSDLTADKFIDALQRFVGRGGVPFVVYSDNATNFVGVRNLFESNKDKLINFVTQEQFK